MAEKTNVPDIRFAGFTDPWEQRKLGEITERYKELVATPQDGYTRMGVRSHAKGTFLAEVEPGQQIEERELSKVRANNLVVNIVFAWEHAVAITTEKDAKALVSHRFPQFSFHDDMEPDFFRYATLDPDFKNHLWLASPSGAGRNKTLNIKTMLEYKFDIPLRSEQARIAVFFQHLDSLITLHQRKYDKLAQLKKSMLDKMFPKPGERFPEIRFAGFTDPWEQRKFSDVVDVCSGKDYKHLKEGPIPVYGTGGFMTSVDEALSYDRDAVGIGRKGTIDKPYLLKAPFWTVDTLFYAIPKSDIDLEFVHCSFLNVDWKSKDESTGLPSLSKEAINETIALVPSFNEQSQLGEFFNNLNSLITLHQRKLELLRNTKKSLLDRMFA